MGVSFYFLFKENTMYQYEDGLNEHSSKTVVIDGYFKDDKTVFTQYLCAIGLDISKNDDDIFFLL